MPAQSFTFLFENSERCDASCMSTARPSWRVPIRNSAATIVSGFVHTATSAIAANAIAQSSAIDAQLFQSFIASHASISSRVTSVAPGGLRLCGCAHAMLPPISSRALGETFRRPARVRGRGAMRDAEAPEEAGPAARPSRS